MDILNTVYPVGSIYMSVNSTSPESFIGGTWEALQNRFLIGAGGSYSVGSEGGEASHKQGQRVEGHFNVGGPHFPIIEAKLYCWEFLAPISIVFPNGILISEDEQKTAIYNWVKSTTGLPFTDVLEERETN